MWRRRNGAGSRPTLARPPDRPVATPEVALVLESLAAAPQRLAAFSQGVESARLYARPSAEAWSATETLAHLRACADVWGKGIAAMLQREHPTMRYVSPRTWLRQTDYLGLSFSVSLQAYTHQRAELLQLLRALPAGGWARGATFTATTKGREQTVLSYAQRLAQHEAEHLAEIEILLKAP